MIAQAQSGTGKTATFSISILQQIDLSLKECQALVLAPTRELAQQIQKVCSFSVNTVLAYNLFSTIVYDWLAFHVNTFISAEQVYMYLHSLN